MELSHHLLIFLGAIFTHNLALTYILGMCPLIALSGHLKTASGMGAAVTVVLFFTAFFNWPLYHLLLKPLSATYISYIVFILVIAGTVQFLEIIIENFFPRLQNAFGIYLPLITVNCTVLAVSLFLVLRDYTFWETLFFALGSGAGWTLALLILAAIKEKLSLQSDIPKGLTGAGITLILAGILAMVFMGFTGMMKIQ